MPQLGNRGPIPSLAVLPALAMAFLVSAGCGGPAKSPAAPEPQTADLDRAILELDLEDPVEPAGPTAYVTLKSITDRSEGKASKRRRAARASSVRNLIVEELRSSPTVTLEAATGEELGLKHFNVDATIEKLDRRVQDSLVEIHCELRLSISDGRGRMLSFLTGGVAVQVPRHSFRRKYEPQLQREALEGAARKINRDLMSYLERETQTSTRVSRR